MEVLITGGAGFIGHHISNFLLSKGYSVEVWDNLSTGKKDRLNDGIKFKLLDLLTDELPSIEKDIVIHLASPTSVEESLNNDEKYMDGCLNMTKRIVEWSISNNVSKFIFSSTSAVYGNPNEIPTKETSNTNPLSPYAFFKLEAEKYLSENNSNMVVTTFRFFNVFGEGQPNSGMYAPAVAKFLKQKTNGEKITITGDGQQTRDYIYVGDLSLAIYKIIESETKSNLYNLGCGKETKILDIAKEISDDISFIPKRNEPSRSCSDISKLHNNHNWSPKTSILNWIRETL